MADLPKPRPPFAWLGAYSTAASLILIVAIGAYFRFNQVGLLPPGVYQDAANVGLQALALLHHGQIPVLNSANGYAPLWVLLQATSIKLLGHTVLALSVMPALLGTLAVAFTWLWVKQWFGVRVAAISALLLAITPWAVTLSRDGLETALIPFVVSFTLYAATLAWRQRELKSYLLLALALSIDLLSGPIAWLLALTILVTGLVLLARQHQLLAPDRGRIAGLTGLAVGAGLLAYLLGISGDTIKSLPSSVDFTSNLATFSSNLGKTLLMFNVRGDDNYRHNLSGEPLLNAFVGLMFVAGVLVSISRLHQRRYRILLTFSVVMLIPAIISDVGVPNAARAVGVLPLVLTLAAIGTSYLLELWYATFPINSAARATGQSAILVLLGLSLLQGYTQYFHAWAGSSEVYLAYNEDAVQMARFLKDQPFSGQRYVVATPAEFSVINYLDYSQSTYQPLDVNGLTGLPIAPTSRQFIIVPPARDAAAKTLKLKFPGGVLRPHYSSFNQVEVYYTYETATK